MRHLIPLFVIFLLAACNTTKIPKERVNVDPQEVVTDYPIPVMTFDKVFHDFGTVKRGEKRETTFSYTNTGTADLQIEIVTSCHCTSLDYSTEPLAPGEKDVIKAVFDSSDKTESELIDITIILSSTNPKTGYPIVEEVKFTFDIEE